MKQIQFLTLTTALLSTSAMASYNTEEIAAKQKVRVVLETSEVELSWVPNLPTKKGKKEDSRQPNSGLMMNLNLISWIPDLPPRKDKNKQLGWIPDLPPRKDKNQQLSWIPDLPPRKDKSDGTS